MLRPFLQRLQSRLKETLGTQGWKQGLGEEEDRETKKHTVLENHLSHPHECCLQQQVGRETEAKMQVLTAELKQGDNFTKRNRPTVVYAGLGCIAINHVVFPVTGRVLMAFFPDIVFDTTLLPDLPSEFWLAWGRICAVWVIGRTREKITLKQ